MLLVQSLPWGNYVGDKSSERLSGAISRGVLSGCNLSLDNFPGAIIQGVAVRGAIHFGCNCPGGNCAGANFPRGQLSSGSIVWGPIIWGTIMFLKILKIHF